MATEHRHGSTICFGNVYSLAVDLVFFPRQPNGGSMEHSYDNRCSKRETENSSVVVFSLTDPRSSFDETTAYDNKKIPNAS